MLLWCVLLVERYVPVLSSLPYFHVHLDRSSLQYGIDKRRQELRCSQIIWYGVMT